MDKKALSLPSFIFSILASAMLMTIDAWAACNNESSTGDCLKELFNNEKMQKAVTDSTSSNEAIQPSTKERLPAAEGNIRVARFLGSLETHEEGVRLSVVCHSNETILFIEWQQRIAGFGKIFPITYQFDTQAAETAEVIALNESSGETQFLDPMPVVKKMPDAKKFTARLLNASGETLTAHFDIKDAPQALTNVRKSCNW